MYEPDRPTHIQAELRLRTLIDEEGLAQPDEVQHQYDPDELWFLWHERKVAIVVELGPEGPVAVRDATQDGAPPI